MSEKHVADGESEFFVLNITPDFCKVGNAIVAFDIAQLLSSDKDAYSETVFARSEKVLLVDSFVKGVIGNAGRGFQSEVSQAQGHSKIVEGSKSVFVESRMTARHHDLVEMNGKVD
jgi:hypothetical protein